MTKLQDYQITLHQTGTDGVLTLALRANNDVLAMREARRLAGKDWFIVTIV